MVGEFIRKVKEAIKKAISDFIKSIKDAIWPNGKQ